MFCSKCGNQVPDGAAFCSACGNRLSAPQVPVVPAEPVVPVAPVVPTEPVVPVAPVVPVEPVAPVAPVEPIAPVVPAPAVPVEPVVPVAPVIPVEPIVPEQQFVPQPEVQAAPVAPVEPVIPVQPTYEVPQAPVYNQPAEQYGYAQPTPVVPLAPQPEPQKPNKKGGKLWIIIVIAVLILGLVGVGVFGYTEGWFDDLFGGSGSSQTSNNKDDDKDDNSSNTSSDNTQSGNQSGTGSDNSSTGNNSTNDTTSENNSTNNTTSSNTTSQDAVQDPNYNNQLNQPDFGLDEDEHIQPDMPEYDEPIDGNYAELEALVDTLRPSLQVTIQQYAQQGINLSVYVDGYSLVYSCQYTVALGDRNKVAQNLQNDLESAEKVQLYTNLCKTLKNSGAPLTQSVRCEFFDVNGKLLASKDYR